MDSNYEARKNLFIAEMQKNDSDLEAEKEATIAKYHALIDEWKKLEADKKIGPPNAATITFKTLVNIDADRWIDAGKIGSPPDNVYDSAKRIAGNISSSGNKTWPKQLYDDMMNVINQKVSILSIMTPNQFKGYKVGLMKLSQQERENLKQDTDFMDMLQEIEKESEELYNQPTEKKLDYFEQRNELQKLLGDSGNNIPYNAYYMMGKCFDGLVIDPEEYKASAERTMKSIPNCDETKAKKIVDCLEKINYEARKKHFITAVQKSDEELDKDREDALQKYDALISSREELKATGKLKPDNASTLSYQTILEIVNRQQPWIKSSSFLPFDELYESVSDSQSYTTREYEEMMSMVKERRESLSGMTPENFRDYQIGLMKLSEKEREEIKEDTRSMSLQAEVMTPDLSASSPDLSVENSNTVEEEPSGPRL